MTAIMNIDDEWSSYLIDKQEDVSSDEENINTNNSNECNEYSEELFMNEPVPEPTEIYISTKSKIAYLTEPIDLKIFWDIPVIPYATANNGVIKKQIKINSKTPEELEFLQERLQNELYYEQHSPTNKKVSFRENEYSLNNSFFDPSKSSPPNDFLLKLKLRMNQYDSCNNVDNLINE